MSKLRIDPIEELLLASVITSERTRFRTMDEARQWAKDRAAYIRCVLVGKDAAA